MGVMNLTKEDLKYIACAIDTEGSLSFGKGKKKDTRLGFHFGLHIDIVNTNKEWLEYLQSLLLREGCKLEVKDRGLGWREIYSMYIPSTICRELLPKVLPFLIIKRRQAEIMIEYWKIRQERGRKSMYGKEEMKLYEEIKSLNTVSHGGDFPMQVQEKGVVIRP